MPRKTDQEHADDIAAAAEELNKAMSEAAVDGVITEITVDGHSTMRHPHLNYVRVAISRRLEPKFTMRALGQQSNI